MQRFPIPSANIIFLATVLLGLASCGGQNNMVGGPCTYATIETTAQVVAAEPDGDDTWRINIVLASSTWGGDTVALRELVHWPATDSLKAYYGLVVGATVPVVVEEITKGTCVPIMGKLVAPQ